MKNTYSIGHSARTALATTALALCSVAWNAQAQFEITTATGNTSQNFNTLSSTTGNTNSFMNDATLTPADSTLDGWSLFSSAAGTNTTQNYRVDIGGGNAGSFYSWGATGNTERALGGIGSSGLPLAYIAFGTTNNAASAITTLTVGFDGEQWRNGGAASPAVSVAQTMAFEYGIGATFGGVTNWTAPGAAFTWTSPVFGTTGAAAVDGNTAGLQAGRGGVLSGVTLAVGETLWLRWIELNDAGNDHGLAIDNFSFSWAQSLNPPKNLLWTPTSGVWDAAAVNWKDTVTTNPAAFTNNDTVVFDDSGLTMNTVTVAAGGVGPGGVTVSNTSGTYTLSGGPINSGSPLVKDGAGTLVLGAAYSQGLNATAGTVRTAANQVFGDSSAVILGNGVTLDLNGNTETVGALTLTGATITTGAGLLTIGGNVTTIVSPTDTPVTISGNLSNGGSTRTFAVTDSLAPEDFILNANLTGGGRASFTGAGTVRLGGDNTAFTGGMQFASGLTYILGSAKVFGTTQWFLNGGTLQGAIPLTGADKVTVAVSLGGNGVTVSGNSLEFGGALTFFGNGTKTYTVDTGLTFAFSNTLTGSNTGSGQSAIVANIIKAGAGTMVFGADGSAYTGNVTINAGAVVVSTANGLGTGAVTLNATAPDTVTLTATVSTAIGALSSSGDGINKTILGEGAASATPVVLTINSATEGAYGGSIATAAGHVGRVVKAGASTQTLSGAQSYASLKVEEGLLILGGALTSPGGAVIDVTPTSGAASLDITVSETISSLIIGPGVVVTLVSPPPVLPAPEFFGRSELAAGAPVQPVPEPAAAALLAGGIAMMLGRRRR